MLSWGAMFLSSYPMRYAIVTVVVNQKRLTFAGIGFPDFRNCWSAQKTAVVPFLLFAFTRYP